MRILSGKNRLKSKKHTNRSESRPLPVDLHAPLADGYALLPFFAKDLLISAFVGSRMQCWLCAARTVPVGVENRARNGFRTRFVPNNQQINSLTEPEALESGGPAAWAHMTQLGLGNLQSTATSPQAD
jgi:hypothetical protein